MSTGGIVGHVSLAMSSMIRGNFTVTVFGEYVTYDIISGMNNTLAATIPLQIHFSHPDFGLSVNPNNVEVGISTSGNTILTVSPFDGFTGNIQLSTTPSSSSLNCNLGSTNIVLGPVTNVMLTCQTNVIGNYTVVITGVSGSISHSLTVNYGIGNPDFEMLVYVDNSTIFPERTSVSPIVIRPLYGFTGDVSLVSSTGPGCSISTKIVQGGSGNSSLACNPNGANVAGNYTVTVTGTSGPVQHVQPVSFRVEDFAISIPEQRLLLTVGNSTVETVVVRLLNGFKGPVNITSTVSGTGLTVQLLDVNQNNTVISYRYKFTPGSTGNYNVTIHGISHGVIHSSTLTVGVSNAPSSNSNQSSLLGNPLVLGLIVAAVAIAASLISLVWYRKKQPARVRKKYPAAAG
jgi:hypothetical protein